MHTGLPRHHAEGLPCRSERFALTYRLPFAEQTRLDCLSLYVFDRYPTHGQHIEQKILVIVACSRSITVVISQDLIGVYGDGLSLP